YQPYEILLGDISEIWRYVRGILPQDYKPHHLPDETNLKNLVDKAKRSITDLENSILKLNQ
ncbi:XRE family transcriptional regulator, partial [Chryseobacterium sp. HMWF028]